MDQIETIIVNNNDLWNLLPADAAVNNAKRDRLVTRETLHHSREAIITCWQITRAAMPGRFDLELNRTLFGSNHAEPQWEAPAFAALVEAVETVAIQRGVERWEPASPSAASAQAHASRTLRNAVQSEPDDAGASLYTMQTPSSTLELDGQRVNLRYHPLHGRTLLDPDEVPKVAFRSALPIVAELAAGPFFDGFETGRLNDLNDLDWIAVPGNLCKPNRFVIRVAGDSMEPLFHIGDLLIFEYHRTPRQDNQIVIAADFTNGSATGEYAVKRYRAHPSLWRFLSENPAYESVDIPKAAMPYPILGTFVGRAAVGMDEQGRVQEPRRAR